MNNIHDFLQQATQGDETAEDRTIHFRETEDGPRIDFVTIERTRFSGAFPETTKEFRSQLPLSCGHVVGKDNAFAGYCQGQNFSFPFFRKVCKAEYCESCAVQCPRCGVFVSAHCHARRFEGVLYCTSCRNKLLAMKTIRLLLAFLLVPFSVKDEPESVQPEKPKSPKRPKQEEQNAQPKIPKNPKHPEQPA